MSGEFVLLSRSPGFRPSTFRLPPGLTIIGRSSACGLVISNVTVSRRHAEIVVADRLMTVRDLGSANGTLVDGQRINSAPAKPGQMIQFGQVAFELSTSDRHHFESDSTDNISTMHAPPVGAATTTADDGALPLPDGQQDILDGLLRGLTEKGIARKLKISQNTVHTQIQRIYRKFDVHSRSELLAQVLKAKNRRRKQS